MDRFLALRLFVRIAEAESFAKAADQLDLPRSTASRLIRDLEQHLGAKLIQRTTRSVSVTAEGASYYERATRLLGELDEMDSAVSNMPTKHIGRLRVDVGSVLANLVIIPNLPKFRALYPGIELHLGVSDRRVALISEGVDCVIRGGDLPDASLIARRLCDLDFVTCASPSYLEEYGTPRVPRDLESGHAIVSYFFAQTGKTYPPTFEEGTQRYEVPVASAMLVNDSIAHLNAVLAGLGIGQILRVAAQSHLESGALIPLLEDYRTPRHEMHIVYPSGRHLNARLRVFVDWIVELFRDLGPQAASPRSRSY
ncbi:LysR family transcriptional regulator (plasmid) [Ensifer adhaerens]|uniref:LysR family transcriptional regulator n=2 Tax=Ensifer adhaerens TaxID=106592 RepID=A0A9Q8YGL4_ENSAD|nr:LysR family transcriptional regulator [Ensifer adhaerens]USJ28528.1 LysR family transcriptional regulator [Ensifer adhaerens]